MHDDAIGLASEYKTAMAEHQILTAETKKKDRLSNEISDKEDLFEDAVDTGSVRPLAERQGPPSRQQSTDTIESRPNQQLLTVVDELKTNGDIASPEPDPQPSKKAELDRLSHTSAASLDKVNPGDAAATQKRKSQNHHNPGVSNTYPTVEEEAMPEQPPREAEKIMSFSSITNVFPSVPWLPPATDSALKNLHPIVTAPATVPAPSSRKLTSPFSWLSRSTSKEQQIITSPPLTTPRRNTASSIATLTSNPEMMLSKLEEENEGEAGGAMRNSLKDRFKLVRMREEAGISMDAGEDKKIMPNAIGSLMRTNTSSMGVPQGVHGEEKDIYNAAKQSPTSPLPPGPNANMAPGTASGVNAGPSMTDAPVDWDLWQSVVYEGPVAVARTSAEDLNKAIAAGIPSAIRGVIWQVLAQSKNNELEGVYRELVARGTDKDRDRQSNGTSISTGSNGNQNTKEPVSSASSIHSEQSGVNGIDGSGGPYPTENDADSILRTQSVAAVSRKKSSKEDAAMIAKLEKMIKRDLGARTSFSKFAAAQGLQEGLFDVCKAYALFDEGVGYAQGMNFMVMPLLFNMPEQEAFCTLVRLMNQYKLRDLFIQDMPGLHMRLYQFERMLEDLEPALYCHLKKRGISPHLYATQWFLTLFAYRFPLQLVLRIYDLVFSEGLSAILRFGIVLMQKNIPNLLAISDMAQLTTFLKDRLFDVYIDAAPSSISILENGFFGSSSNSIDKEVYRADQFVRDACEMKMTPELLKSYATEWQEKTGAEKEREAELEGLRSSNAAYAISVRRLEERIEAVDREQAILATELVRTRVQNEELQDENEGLKGQVMELRVVIEKQPLEIEQAWQTERDELTKKNGQVHKENQKLEKELADLEEQLVQTKMRYAEINSQHEALTRKWTGLKRQFA